jgi:heme exporter protein D
MLHLDMGRYAAYVWPAYGVSAAVLIAMVWDSLARAARWRRAAEQAEPPSRESGP